MTDHWNKLRNPHCRDCRLGETAKWVCLIGQGPVPCDVMIVGEAPGEREEGVRKPFSGTAGKLLDRMLDEAGLSRDKVYITNVVHCRPPDNRTPTKDEIQSCKKYLQAEMDLVKPKYVLLLGNVALQGVLGRSGITKYRGEIFEQGGVKYLPTLHPAAALRQPKYMSVIKADINRFARLVKQTLTLPEDFKWRLVRSSEDLRQCIDDIMSSNRIAFDVETRGINPLASDATIYCLGIATPQCSWVIPFDYPGSKFKSKEVAKRVFEVVHRSVTQAPLRIVCAHNGKFDNKWLKSQFGIRFPLNFDTMLAAYLLDENSPHGLKYLASLYFNAPDYDIQVPPDPKVVSLQKLAKYCALDVYYTLALQKILEEELRKDRRIERVFHQLLMPASDLFEGVELHGVYVDVDKMESTYSYLKGQIEELEHELNQLAGRKINWNSHQQVASVLYGDLKLPIVAFTPSGNPSTSSEEALPFLLDEHPIVEKLLKYREKVKLYQFIESWKEKINPKTNRMYPSFKLHGTVTGRLSCEEPNLQQVPRDPEVRTLITAPPGWVLVEADYSQIELRVAACLSKDRAMKGAFQTGEDIHIKTAMAVTGLPAEKIDKEMRKKAKAVNFGFVYGMGAAKFRNYAKVKYGVDLTEEEAYEFRERFFELYPLLPEWHERQRRFVTTHGYVRTPIGRKRRLPEIMSNDKGLRSGAERQAINSPVQGAASDLNLFAAIRIARTFPDDVRIIATVHDAVLMEVRESKVEEILPQVKNLMEDREAIFEAFSWDIPVPIEVEIKVGPWGAGRVFNPEERE